MSVFQPALRSSSALRALCMDALIIVTLSSCLRRDDVNTTGTSDKGDASRPSLDARGGEANSDVILGRRTASEGDGGAGGSIRVTTSGGSITIRQGAIAASAQTPSFTGTGFDVQPGQTVKAAAAYHVEWLRVQEGGTLELVEDAFFLVDGDVLIAGQVVGRGDKHAIDGRDLTIDSDGIVNITGVIDCGGYEVGREDLPPSRRTQFAGGHGGEIYISSQETTSISPGPHIFVSGRIAANGGDTFSTDSDTARPGKGGQLLIGTFGSLAVTGRLSARGGKCYFTADGNEALGGSIEIVAASSVQIGGVREVTANGGDSSGGTGGAGGSVLLEAPVGSLDLDDFDIECRGGRSTFATTGEAGAGGTATFTAATVLMTNMEIDASGGDAVRADSGEGGTGGTVQIAGTTAITVGGDVVIHADGGQTNLAATHGGTGGTLKVINLDESSSSALDFDGAATVEGGKDAVHSSGADGSICVAGSNTASNIKLVGNNNFPISNCTDDDLDDVVVHDMDCEDNTIRPADVTSTLPVIIGVDFFRVIKTSASTDTVTVSTTGEDGGNVDLYTGPDTVLGSLSTGAYTQSSTNSDSTESIDVDVSGLAVGDFFSVMVRERFTFVEQYTITIECE
ncbi:MAG: hypothetical protein HY721_14610 [Planctomycetes bacterium]|nr:hypothetical protein [Planctomycetota bacterium]